MRYLRILISLIMAGGLASCASPTMPNYNPSPPPPPKPQPAKTRPMAMPTLKLQEQPQAKVNTGKAAMHPDLYAVDQKHITNSIMPRSCSDKGYKVIGEDILLNVGQTSLKQGMFALYNKYNRAINVSHHGHPSARAGSDVTILPGRYAALALDKGDFVLTCEIAGKKGKMNSVSCDDVLQICRANHPKFMVGTQGSYWVVENKKSARQLAVATGVRGIVF